MVQESLSPAPAAPPPRGGLSLPELPVGSAALPGILILFPAAVALGGRPLMVGTALAVCLLLAHACRCLKPFLAIVVAAFLINASVLSGFAIFSDTDDYWMPAVRFLASDVPIVPDGGYAEIHLQMGYPAGFMRWGAALYRLTGWVDAAAVLPLILAPAAWLTARRAGLGRIAATVLTAGPLAFFGIFNPMPDASVYLLLLTAAVALRDRTAYALPLGAALLACYLKQTAWIPTFFILAVLLRHHPRRMLRTVGAGVAVAVLMIPFLRATASGLVSTADFYGMDETAKSMGYWARQIYAYLGHWLIPGPAPQFNVAVGGGDGGGVDGLGPFFRLSVWISLGILLFCRRCLNGWGAVLLVCWAGVLTVPTVYIGYARYAPLVYPAVMLPLALRFPRLAVLPAVLVCAMPAAWVGWRVMRSSENLYALSPAVTAVHADGYNVRCGFRGRLAEVPQPTLAGSLAYTYTGTGEFPPMPRGTGDQRLIPAFVKARGLIHYAFAEWLPYALSHLPEMALQTVRYRWSLLISPRGETDGIQTS